MECICLPFYFIDIWVCFEIKWHFIKCFENICCINHACGFQCNLWVISQIFLFVSKVTFLVFYLPSFGGCLCLSWPRWNLSPFSCSKLSLPPSSPRLLSWGTSVSSLVPLMSVVANQLPHPAIFSAASLFC